MASKQSENCKSDESAAPTAGSEGGGESSVGSALSIESGMFPAEDSPPISTPNDVRTRSGLEQEVLEDLLMKDAVFTYESTKLKWSKQSVYTPDFVITTASGKKIVIEAKGFFRASDRQKMLAVIDQHPHLDIRMIFERVTTKISKRSKTTYAQWCDRHGIKWALHNVPKEWLEE